MYKIWIDEAWRWPWFWVVVACSLAFNPENMPNKELLEKINDSKKLSDKKRQEIFDELIKLSSQDVPWVYFWVWVVDNYIIDEINIKFNTLLQLEETIPDDLGIKKWQILIQKS